MVVRRQLLWAVFATGLAVLSGLAVAGADSYGPQGPEQGPWRRQIWRLPSSLPGTAMHAVVLRPPGEGPFPLMLMNHGSSQSLEARLDMALPGYGALTRFFLKRGYAVALPLRPGHADTGGRYLEDQNGCEAADFLAAGNGSADSIAAALAYLTTQRFVRRTGAIIVGHSAGAWGALALASRGPAGVAAVIAFAAGRGGHSYGRAGENCAPERLIAAAGRYGATTRVPTLWLYAANDSYFSPALSRRLADAFVASGGRADYRLLPAFGADGHFLILDDAAEPLWAPAVDEFLKRLK